MPRRCARSAFASHWAKFCAAGDKAAIGAETRKALERVAYKSSRPERARFYLDRVERMLGRDSVVCGPLETITVKRNGKSLGEGVTNPVVIIEVLSESTERYDREEKFSYYRTLPSLQEVVVVAQDDATIEVFRRPTSGPSRQGWALPAVPGPGEPAGSPGWRGGWDCELARAGGTITIHGCTIAVDAVYGTRG